MAKSKSKTTRSKTQSPAPPAHIIHSQAAAAAPNSPSLLRQACKFLSTTAGLDLTLRLFHGLVIVAAQASSDDIVATRSSVASWQLNLGTSRIIVMMG